MTGFATLRRAARRLESLPGRRCRRPRPRCAPARTQLTKPPGSLGRLEDAAAWLARWQGRAMPRLDRVEVLVFAGNHGVVARGVSPYPAAVTAQMVANFAAGGAAINQIARAAGASLRVIPLDLDTPTADFCEAPAMDAAGSWPPCRRAADAVAAGTDLLCLGEMGIGNTTAAAALAAALFGGGGARWAGRGTGLDDAGLARKAAVIDAALARHAGVLGDALAVARGAGRAGTGGDPGRGAGGAAAWACRCCSTASSAPPPPRRWRWLRPGGAGPCLARPRLGRGRAPARWRSGLAWCRCSISACGWARRPGRRLAVPLLRAALACHAGMATFAEAGVADRD